MDSLSTGERTGTSGMSQAEVRRKMGVDFEAENEGRDIERFRGSSDAERAAELNEVVLMAEAITRSAGHEPGREPAPSFPDPVDQDG